MAWNFGRSDRLAARAASRQALLLGAEEAQSFCRAVEGIDGIGFWASDAQGAIRYLSEKALVRLPSPDAVLGQPLTDVFDTRDDGAGSGRSLRFVLSRRSRFEKLTVCTGDGGQRRWWQLSGEAQFGPGGGFEGFCGLCAEITDERRVAEENSRDAMHDPLTGLINRREMARALERTLSAYRVQERPCATLLIDLDRFKQVNDTLGHSTGDALLRQVADRLVTIVGQAERICRLGGDEFQILVPDVEDRGDLGNLAERIIAMLSQPYSVEGNRCIIGASVGIAVAPFDGQDVDELVRNADLALYAAKHGGRGRFRFFSRDLLTAAEDRRMLEEHLHDALARGELELHYQPIVAAGSDAVSGAEALMRWNHPGKGVISPAQFIPIAEESPMICQIGEWALRQACQDAAQWPGDLRVAVNVSPRQFTDTGFPAVVASALAASGLAAERLELEITEGVFLAEGADTDARFHTLKALGVRLALDDFGTGYSSLGYLRTAPFDKIKIDQSFVRGTAEAGTRNKALISAIVAMAKAIGMETTAEGIETLDQLAMMRELGVSHVQGFVYAQAMPAAEFLAAAAQPHWGIVPSGPARQRGERISMFRWIGAIHEDHYYPAVLRNLSATGALIDGLEDVPVGTRFVLYFGEGQLEVATVRRTIGEQLGVAFEKSLVNDGNGGLCTRTRISPYDLVNAGLPPDFEVSTIRTPIAPRDGRIAIPAFTSTVGRKAIQGTGVSTGG
ncbi:putative bifunctional diguanylate cyclase/phosphodiesterase [Sphingomonas sp. IC081]|uniref:putative bifunctional diguanylate cyclase/phosphodiesterase n=1 Tax=Sphingomonas sp. IC081 TaxID=304378 RepID=UPI001157E225|nr:EAL domain-containing protein [Sphingomonas sp. IC081]QDK34597.1 GGDEF domain-containing protein [Sphingomonas sp. IC081]